MKAEKSRSKFLLCVRNDGSDDLEPRKMYQVLLDPRATREGFVRVIDESGEDYLYPAEYFVPVKLPVVIVRTFLCGSKPALQPQAQKVGRPHSRQIRRAIHPAVDAKPTDTAFWKGARVMMPNGKP
jgi:glycine/D-amino acid oxidase-like deaminating enzyme